MKRVASMWSETRCRCNGREWNYPNSVARWVSHELKGLSWWTLDEMGWDSAYGYPEVGAL